VKKILAIKTNKVGRIHFTYQQSIITFCGKPLNDIVDTFETIPEKGVCLICKKMLIKRGEKI
jgi:hypothetical protein